MTGTREPADSVALMIRDHYVERITELEADHENALIWFRAAIHLIAARTQERDQARRSLQQLTRTLGFDAEDRGYTRDDARTLREYRRAPRPTPTVRRGRYATKHRATAARDLVQ